MLEFFRKYQRYFFIVITAMVVASFCFFGTFSAVSEMDKQEDKVIGQAIDGSPMLSSQIQKLSRFIASDREDPLDRGAVNFLNDGVIRYDFLRTGLADLLVSEYFDDLKEDLAARFERAKRFRPYAHQTVPFLSARAVWERFLPAMNRELNALQTESEVSPKTFTHFSKLYQQQSYLQPEILRRILAMQHNQAFGAPDQRLMGEDLSLFGFHSTSDWFGRRFIDLISQFILNASIQAEEKGYRVSLEEAKGDLIYTFQQSMDKLAEAKADVQLSFHEQLRLLGFDERSAAETWTRVLLFRKYFQDVGQAAFADRLPYRDFAGYVQETACVQKYKWARALELRNIDDLIEFQVYLKAVSLPVKDLLALPTALLSVDEVEKNYPELVRVDYKAKVSELSKQEIGLKASLKEIWDWQLEDKNWQLLKKEFPDLKAAGSREERFQSLQALNPAERAKIDAISRVRRVDSNPNWIEEAFLNAPISEKTISVSSSFVSLSHIEESKRFAELMEKASLGDETAANSLLRYSDDGKVIYRIEGVEKSADRHILTFEKARGALKKIASRYLEAKNPDKTLKEKEAIANAVFGDLFRAIAKAEKAQVEPAQLAAFAAKHRLAYPARQALAALQKNRMDPQWVQSGGNPLLDQFKLETVNQEIQRTSQEEWMKEQVFVMVPDQWSPIYVAEDGKVVFFYLEEKKAVEKPILEQLSFGKETLAADAQLYLAEKFLKMAKAKKAIVIAKQEDEE